MTDRRTGLFLRWLLIPAFILMQASGLMHRISHASAETGQAFQVASGSLLAAADVPYHDVYQHSCRLVDATLLAHFLPTADGTTFQAFSTVAVLQQHPETVWLAQLLLHFSSRAPPLL
jgi:hypothetical protein